MPFPENQAAIACAAICGSHQQVYAQENRLEAEPAAFGDFAATPATYEIGGETVAAADFFQDGGGYNAANLVAGSGFTWIEGGNYTSNLDPAAFAECGSGYTAVIEADVPAGTTVGFYAYENDNFVPYSNFAIATNGGEVTGAHCALSDNATSLTLSPELSAGIHRFAVTYVSGRMAISVDGSAVESDENAETWATTIDEMGFYISAGLADTFMRHIAVYPPQDDEALPILSALE